MSNIRKTFTKRELDMIEEMRKQVITLQKQIDSLDPGNVDIATTQKPGIVKIGNGLNISSDGLLSTVSSTGGITVVSIELNPENNTFICSDEQAAIEAFDNYIRGTTMILFIVGSLNSNAYVFTPIRISVQHIDTTDIYTAVIQEIGKTMFTCSITHFGA